MPSWELFEQQPQSYREGVLPPDVTARVSVEQASQFGWDRYVGPEGARIGMETFGASAPLQELQKKFGFTVEHVAAAARAQLERRGGGSHASWPAARQRQAARGVRGGLSDPGHLLPLR